MLARSMSRQDMLKAMARSVHKEVITAIQDAFNILEYSQLRWWRAMVRSAGTTVVSECI